MKDVFNTPETPAINTPKEFPNFEEYSIDNESKLKLSFNDKLVSFSVTKSSLPPKDYQSILSLEELNIVQKALLKKKTTKDLVDWVINSFNQKTASIKFIDKICILQITNPVLGEIFKINLNQKQNDIYPSITSLKNNTIEPNNNYNNNDFETYKIEQNKKINALEERIKQLEDIVCKFIKEKEEKEEKQKKSFFYESKTLNKEAKEMLLNWLPKKPVKLTLLLNSKQDGSSLNTFWEKVNGKCPTLIVIETIEGCIFGGYTTQLWKDDDKPIRDENAFVFSIDKKKKYNIKQPENAIGFSKNKYLIFGWNNNAFLIYNYCTTQNGNYVCNGTYDIPDKYELNGGEQYFIVRSFEVYHVEY